MKRSRFSETQLVAILKEADSGVPVQKLCRKHGTSNVTLYKRKSKYGGLEASDLKHLRELEAENSKLKRVYADLTLENEALKPAAAGQKSSETTGASRGGGVGCNQLLGNLGRLVLRGSGSKHQKVISVHRYLP
jgi:putative transposase